MPILPIRVKTTALKGELEGFHATWKLERSVEFMGQLQKAQKQAGSDDPEESIKAIEDIIRVLAPKLTSWDLETSEGPLPTTEQSLQRLDVDHLMLLFESFTETINDDPLVQKKSAES